MSWDMNIISIFMQDMKYAIGLVAHNVFCQFLQKWNANWLILTKLILQIFSSETAEPSLFQIINDNPRPPSRMATVAKNTG